MERVECKDGTFVKKGETCSDGENGTPERADEWNAKVMDRVVQCGIMKLEDLYYTNRDKLGIQYTFMNSNTRILIIMII